ncbi:MAG: hypothetical protein LBN94_02050, partial [Puniceicoccales bacterium]|nr:hypothetical protein [Puniceicoccales bacterium]
MLSKKISLLGVFLLQSSLFSFESHYGELASLLKNHVRALDSSVTQHSVEAKKIFPHNRSHPFELYGAIHYSKEGGKHYHSDDGIACFGLDTSYDNFILKRTCAIGLMGGIVRDCVDYKSSAPETGNLRMGFGSYYCNFHILG